MSHTWREVPDRTIDAPGAVGLLRAALRGLPLVILLAAGLGTMLLLRLVEKPLCHPRRPLTPWITVMVCRGAIRVLGLQVRVDGQPLRGPGAIVANHSTWLDIFALNAQAPVVFVSKAEVAGWPGIGRLARATGTLFLRRGSRADAARQARAMADRLGHGETLLFFPEGTSTDGRQVLPFRAALFSGLLSAGTADSLAVQPVTVRWESPAGEDARFYSWWGDMDFGPHVLSVLAARRSGRVRITFHQPIPVTGHDRKTLAARAEAAVRSAL